MSEKIFRDTRTQIGLLKSRGLTIKHPKFAKQIIRKVNYYNLINGYKDPFLQTGFSYEKYNYVCNLLSHLYKTISKNINSDLSITHYVSGKNYVPLWVLMNSLSFGEMSKFYTNMHQKERTNVAKYFKWGIKENLLSNSLTFLTTIRNRCAHDERLYSYLSTTNLSGNKYFKYFHITTTNNYFAVMITFKLLLSDIKYKEYQYNIEILLNELSLQLTSIPLNKIRGIMGLPNNWRRLQSL